jgi:hypothetical protein
VKLLHLAPQAVARGRKFNADLLAELHNLQPQRFDPDG